jgi:hypothetical protein
MKINNLKNIESTCHDIVFMLYLYSLIALQFPKKIYKPVWIRKELASLLLVREMKMSQNHPLLTPAGHAHSLE